MVIIGSGIMGLAHAAAALEAGYEVTVVDRDHRPVGASLRNFGHICITAQGGLGYELARAGRPIWMQRAQQAGFWLVESGTAVVASTPSQVALLEEFHATRQDSTCWIELDELQTTFGLRQVNDNTQALHLTQDLRVNPREVVPKMVSWLEQEGVDFHWGTSVLAINDGSVMTSRGEISMDRAVVAVNHDIEHLFPDLADDQELTRCALMMMRVQGPSNCQLPAAVLTGTSMLRYDGFPRGEAHEAVYIELLERRPMMMASGCNLMVTQLPDGSFLLGDTHVYDRAVEPFMSGEWAEMLLREAVAELGIEFSHVIEYWQGVYLSGTGQLLHEQPRENVDVVSALSGIGMTTAFGLADRVSQAWHQ